MFIDDLKTKHPWVNSLEIKVYYYPCLSSINGIRLPYLIMIDPLSNRELMKETPSLEIFQVFLMSSGIKLQEFQSLIKDLTLTHEKICDYFQVHKDQGRDQGVNFVITNETNLS